VRDGTRIRAMKRRGSATDRRAMGRLRAIVPPLSKGGNASKRRWPAWDRRRAASLREPAGMNPPPCLADALPMTASRPMTSGGRSSRP